MKKFLVLVIALGVAFLAGYIPEYLQVQELKQQSAAAQEKLQSRIAALETKYEVAQIHSRLGMLILQVEQKNFGDSLKISTALFDQIAASLPTISDAASRQVLSDLSKQRDAITSALTSGSPDAAGKLKQFYEQLGKAVLAG